MIVAGEGFLLCPVSCFRAETKTLLDVDIRESLPPVGKSKLNTACSHRVVVGGVNVRCRDPEVRLVPRAGAPG